MKNNNKLSIYTSLAGGGLGALLLGALLFTLSGAIAAPTAQPPDGNPSFPAQGVNGVDGTDGISGFRIAQQTWQASTFAKGVVVGCLSNEYAVGCSHTCTSGADDTNSWPTDERTCQGHEATDGNHAGGSDTCTLYAHCLEFTN
jgi:hypothetical protein